MLKRFGDTFATEVGEFATFVVCPAQRDIARDDSRP